MCLSQVISVLSKVKVFLCLSRFLNVLQSNSLQKETTINISFLIHLCFTSTRTYNLSISPYYVTEEDSPFICSAPRENGMLRCHDVPAYSEGGVECSATVGAASVNGCVNWNQYYNVCQQGDHNPHKGAVNFDNIGYAWIAIFQVRWTTSTSSLQLQ